MAVPIAQVGAAQIVPAAYLRHPPDPLQVPSFPQLDGPWSLHIAVGSTPPFGTTRQTPAEPGRLHAKQLAVQAVEQQMPWAQKPDEHSFARVQTAPFGFLPHSPFWQVFAPEHWLLFEHEVAQTGPLQRYGAQLPVAVSSHTPLSQTQSSLYRLVAGSQLPERQTVPFAYVWQAPEPLHAPFVPQAAGPRSWHCRRGSGVDAGTFTQRPGELGKLQNLQLPVQALSQQTPSTQKVDLHSLAAAHAWPGPFLPQLPDGPGLAQVFGLAQSALEAHVALHAFPEQMYGKQVIGVPMMQVPVPLHVPAGTWLPPEQLDG